MKNRELEDVFNGNSLLSKRLWYFYREHIFTICGHDLERSWHPTTEDKTEAIKRTFRSLDMLCK